MYQVKRQVTEERLKLHLTHREIRMLISAAHFADNAWDNKLKKDDEALEEDSPLGALAIRLAREDSDVYQEHP